MNKSISTRQIILILLVSLLSLKVLYLPSLLASNIGRNSFVYDEFKINRFLKFIKI